CTFEDVNSRRTQMRLNLDAMPDSLEVADDEIKINLSAPASTFVVNLASDLSDSDPLDGACDVDAVTSGDQCTLLAAIEQANADSAPDLFQFAIPGSVIPRIDLTSPLPTIAEPLTIDGTSQAGGMVEMNAIAAGAFNVGLDVIAGNTVLRGLVINNVAGTAI